MRLFDNLGQRLYLDARERELFLKAASELENRHHRMFCHVLHWTGARISEVLELTGDRIDLDRSAITIRTLKQRKRTKKGELKRPKYRQVPVPRELLDSLDLLVPLRKMRKKQDPDLSFPLWPSKSRPEKPFSRLTAWRAVKKAMNIAGIEGPQATAKGLRHGAAIALIMGGMDVYTLQRILGHAKAETTAIYLQARGQEAHEMQMQYWERANKDWQD